MSAPLSAPWRNRGLVLLGRGSTGLLPLILFGLTSRLFGLGGLGRFAATYMLALGVAEIADFAAQRHLCRLVGSQAPPDVTRSRAAAFNGLRLAALAAAVIAAAGALLAGAGSGDFRFELALLSIAAWAFATNTYYASALALDRFLLIGLGPSLCLVVATTLVLTLSRLGIASGVWAVVISIHAAKLAETVLLAARLPVPEFTIRRDWLAREWQHTRYLFFTGVLSAANARLIVPLASAVGGAQAAGVLSLGMSILAVTSLLSVAITVPAYRDVLHVDVPETPAHAMRRARHDWLTGLWLGTVVTLGLAAAAGWILAPRIGITLLEQQLALALVVLGGVFESLTLFAGALYHASHQDRRLFGASIATMALNWVAIVVGVRVGGLEGMALALLASRAAGVLVLYLPILVGLFARRLP